jgi:hypothetical protein
MSVQVRNEAQTLVQEIRKTTDAKVQSIKVGFLADRWLFLIYAAAL